MPRGGWMALLLGAFGCGQSGASTEAVETPGADWRAEVGVGHEVQSAPLFQLSPQSTVIYIPGLQRLRGSHLRAGISGTPSWQLPAGASVSLGLNALAKYAPDTPDLGFSSVAVQPMWHLPLPGSSLGLGLNLQALGVAGRRFRESRALQVNWARPDGRNLWALMGEVGVNRHPGTLSDLNARTASLVLQRHLHAPWPGIDAFNLSLITNREGNSRGLPELSYRSTLIHATVSWRMAGLDWTFGQAWRRARFDAVAFDGEPVRRDRGPMSDLGVSWVLSPARTLRLELNDVRNRSTTRLYDNQYWQFTVALSSAL